MDGEEERTTTVTDPATKTRVYVSPMGTGRIDSVTNELGHTISQDHDDAGRLTEITLPEGNSVHYTYDTRGNVVETRHVSKTPSAPADIVISATYPTFCVNPRTCNKPTSTTDAAGATTDYTYDDTHGGVLTVTGPAPLPGSPRPQTRFSYDQFQARYEHVTGWINGSPVWRMTATSTCASSTDGCEGTDDETRTTIAYPGPSTPNNLLPMATTTAAGDGSAGATLEMTYTQWGDVSTIEGPLDGATRFYYDAGRRLVGVVGPDPDAGGPLLRRAVRTIYDTTGLPTVVERGTVSHQGDAAFSTFSALEKEDTVYDQFARPIYARLWDGASIVALSQFNYDDHGRVHCTAMRMNPATFTNPPPDACAPETTGPFGADRITRAVYDEVGRVEQVESGVGTAFVQTTESYTYTPNGRVATLADARGYLTTYEYDGFDRLVKRRYPRPDHENQSSTTDFEAFVYDGAGRLTEERRRSGQAFTFDYDTLGRITARTASDSSEPSVTYTYDLLGRVISESRGGHTIELEHDALARVTSDESGALGTVSYQYDAAGRRTRMDYPDGFYVTYTYNEAGDLTSILENGSTPLAMYAYDNLGRRTSLTRGNGVVTSYTYEASRIATLAHDPEGSSHDATFGFAYNPIGQITSRTRTNGAYDWVLPAAYSDSYDEADGLNRYPGALGATPTYDMNGNLTGDGTRTYGYDSDNRLAAASGGVELDYDAAGRLHRVTGGGTTRFLYDGVDVIAEYDDSGSVLRRYVHGPGLDEPLVWYEGSGTSDRRWLIADERGSVIGITDGSGTVTQVNKYDAFGVPDSANQGRFQYTGQMWIAEVGLYHYKARAYHPRLGRFMQTDPIGYAGGMNLYGYVANDPVNLTDPFGLCTWSVLATSTFDDYGVATGSSFSCAEVWNYSVPVVHVPRSVQGPSDGSGGVIGRAGQIASSACPILAYPDSCEFIGYDKIHEEPTGNFLKRVDYNYFGVFPIFRLSPAMPVPDPARRGGKLLPIPLSPEMVTFDWYLRGGAILEEYRRWRRGYCRCTNSSGEVELDPGARQSLDPIYRETGRKWWETNLF